MPDQERLSVLLTDRILVAYPDLLDVSCWMTSSEATIDGVQVRAITRRYETRWRLEDHDLSIGVEPMHSEINAVAAELAGEMLAAKFEAAAAGMKIIPYKPVMPYGFLIDPVDFSHVMGFFCRFGLMPA